MLGLSSEVIKILGAVLGPLILIALIYFKGRSDGKDRVREAARKAEDKLRKKVRNAEIKNKAVDKTTQQKLEEIDNAKSLRQLMRMWNEGDNN